MYEIMTRLELLAALKTMTVSEQLEVLEVTSKIIREELNVKEGLNVNTDMEIAADKMQAYYTEDSDLTTFTDSHIEDLCEYAEYAQRLPIPAT
jgi:hypothetical protein